MSENRKRDPRGLAAVCIRPESTHPSTKAKPLPSQVSSAWSISKITSKIVPTKLKCRNCEHARNFVFRLRAHFDQEKALMSWSSVIPFERAKLEKIVFRKRIYKIKIQSIFDLWLKKAQDYCGLRCSLASLTLSRLSKLYFSQRQKVRYLMQNFFEIWLQQIKCKQRLRAVHQKIQNCGNRRALCTGLNLWRLHSSEAAICGPSDPDPNQPNPADLTTVSVRNAIVQRLFCRAAVNAIARRSHRAVLSTFSRWLFRVLEQRGRRLFLWRTAHRSWNRLLADALGRWRSSRVDQARLARLSRTITLDAAFAAWLSPSPSHKVASLHRVPEDRLGYVATALRLRFWAAWRCASDASTTRCRLASNIAALQAMSRGDMQALSALSRSPNPRGQGDVCTVRRAALRALRSAQACLLAAWHCTAGRARVLQSCTTTTIRRRSRSLLARLLGAWAGWAQARCRLGRLFCAVRRRAARKELIRTWGDWQARVSRIHANGGRLQPTTIVHISVAELFYCQALLGITLWREAVRISGWRRRKLLRGWRVYEKGSSRAIKFAWWAWSWWHRAQQTRQTRLAHWRSRRCNLVCWVVCQWKLITGEYHRNSQIEGLQRVRRQAARKRLLLEWASAVLLLRRRRIIGLSLTRQHLFWQISTAYSAWANVTEQRSESNCEVPGTVQVGADQGLAENRPLSISCSPLKFSDSDGGVDLLVNFGGNHEHDPLRLNFNIIREEIASSVPSRNMLDLGEIDWFDAEEHELSGSNGDCRVHASDDLLRVPPRQEGDKKSSLDQIHEFEGWIEPVSPTKLKTCSPDSEYRSMSSAVEQEDMFYYVIKLGHKEFMSLRNSFSSWFDHKKDLEFYKKLHLKLEAQVATRKLSNAWKKWKTWTPLQAHACCSLSRAICKRTLAHTLKKELNLTIQVWTVWSGVSYSIRTRKQKQKNLTCWFHQRTLTAVMNQWKQTVLMEKLVWKIQVLINREEINIKSELETVKLVELNYPLQLLPNVETDGPMTYLELMEELCVPKIQSEILPLCLQRWERELVKLKVLLQDCESEKSQLKTCLENATSGTCGPSEGKDPINSEVIQQCAGQQPKADGSNVTRIVPLDVVCTNRDTPKASGKFAATIPIMPGGFVRVLSVPVNAHEDRSHYMTRITSEMKNYHTRRVRCEGFRAWNAILKLAKRKQRIMRKILTKYQMLCLTNALKSWQRKFKSKRRVLFVTLALSARKKKQICSKLLRKWKKIIVLSRTLNIKKVRILYHLSFKSAQQNFNIWASVLFVGKSRRKISSRISIRRKAESCLTTIVLWKDVMLNSFNQQIAVGRISGRRRGRGIQYAWRIWTEQAIKMWFQRRRACLVSMWMSRRLKSTGMCVWKEIFLEKCRCAQISCRQIQKKKVQIVSIIFARWIQNCCEKNHLQGILLNLTRRVQNRCLNLYFREWSESSFLFKRIECKALVLSKRSKREQMHETWVAWSSETIKSRKWKRHMMSASERWRLRYFRLVFFNWTELGALAQNHFYVHRLQRLRRVSNFCEHLLCIMLDTYMKKWMLCSMRSRSLEVNVDHFHLQSLQTCVCQCSQCYFQKLQIRNFQILLAWQFLQHKIIDCSRTTRNLEIIKVWRTLTIRRFHKSKFNSSCCRESCKDWISGKSCRLSLIKYVQLFYQSILQCSANQKKNRMVQRSLSTVWNKWVFIKDKSSLLNQVFKVFSVKKKQACASKCLDKWLLSSRAAEKSETLVANHYRTYYLGLMFKTWLKGANRTWPKIQFGHTDTFLHKRTNESLRKSLLSWLTVVQRSEQWAVFLLKYLFFWRRNRSCEQEHGKQKQLLWSSVGLMYGLNYEPSFREFGTCSHLTHSLKTCSKTSVNQFTCSFWQASRIFFLNSNHTTIQFENLIEIAVALLIRKKLLAYVYQCWCMFLHSRQLRSSRAKEFSLRTAKRAMEHWIYTQYESSVCMSKWSILVKCALLSSQKNQICSGPRCIHGDSRTRRGFICAPFQIEDAAEKEIHLHKSPFVRLLFLAYRRALLSNMVLRWRVAPKALKLQRLLLRLMLIGIVSSGHKSCLRSLWNLWRVHSKDSQTWRLHASLQRQACTVESLLHIINIQANIVVPPQVEGHMVQNGSDSCKDLAARPDP